MSASSLNKAMLIGHIGVDAELKYIPSGTPVASFTLATNSNWTDKDGQKQERVEWHRIVVWNKLAESLAQYLVKGRQVYVEGSLQTREWEKDGIKRYTTEIRAFQIQLLGKKEGGGITIPPAGGTSPDPGEDEIPF